tara:strand:- start:190 stop:318 length:129 start_codon:yes stop_codon:yes gene_type:complete
MYYALGILYFILGFLLVFGIGLYFSSRELFNVYLDDEEDWLE